jgi:transcription-repair coupling factor (superfamily II helicase)
MPATIEIILPFEALIPTYYIPDEQEKISAYQKLAGSEDENILAEFEVDLREEYGPLPLQVQKLLEIIRLKMACRRGGVIRIKMDTVSSTKRDVVMTLSPRVTAAEIMQLLQVCPSWRVSGSTLRMSEDVLKKVAGTDDWLREITKHVAALQKKTKKK